MIARLVLVLLAAGSMAVPDLGGRAGDFRPFEMTIEIWNREAVGHSDGRTESRMDSYRLEYWDRGNWTLALYESGRIVDGTRCQDGDRYHYDQRDGWTYRSSDPTLCDTVVRWIHWGIAWGYGWKRELGPEPGQVTYTDPGERVVFDLRTGLPIVYEAGRVGGDVGYRETYRLERFLDD